MVKLHQIGVLSLLFSFGSLLCAHVSTSMCRTAVYFGDTMVYFQVDDILEVDDWLKRFCKEHLLSPTDCFRVKQQHIENCFGPTQATAPTRDEAKNADGESEGVKSNVASRRPIPIDYSQKVGPTIDVDIEGHIHLLQSFSGESPAQTVTRFCGLTKLEPHRCQQVRKAWFELVGAEFSDNGVQNNAISSGNGWMASEYHLLRSVLAEVNAWLDKYWSWVVLIASIVFVIMGHHGI